MVSSTIAFFWKEFGRPIADPPFLYVTQLNDQHHLPLLRLLKALGGTYVDSVRPGPQGLHYEVWSSQHPIGCPGGTPFLSKTLPYSTKAWSGNFHLRSTKNLSESSKLIFFVEH